MYVHYGSIQNKVSRKALLQGYIQDYLIGGSRFLSGDWGRFAKIPKLTLCILRGKRLTRVCTVCDLSMGFTRNNR